MAAAFALAGRNRRDEPYWHSWSLANLVLGAALLVFIFERHLPPLLTATLPNGLLVLGFAMRWRAAREFSGRPAPAAMTWLPCIAFALIVAPTVGISYAPAFIICNVALTALLMATAYEFWRDHDGLPSRWGLVAAYGIMAASFAFRIGQGLLEAQQMPMHLPHDVALIIHLVVALVHASAAGAFSLSLAYERANARLAYAAEHDALTGVLNRGAFDRRLRRRLESRGDADFAVALFDIDHFKKVNDRFGHAAGDEALRRCAEACRNVVLDRGHVARIGGEEFAILLEGVDRAAAHAVVESIRRTVARTTMNASASTFRVTVSGGVCHGAEAPRDFDALMRLVDEGLYRAKRQGRDRIEKIAA